MGFLSTGMIIGLEEGFRTKQEEIDIRWWWSCWSHGNGNNSKFFFFGNG